MNTVASAPRRWWTHLLSAVGRTSPDQAPATPQPDPAPAAPGARPQPSEGLELSDAQWRQRLTQAQYAVLRREATERPGSSPLNDEKRSGRYLCAGCGQALFTSEMKFDSGTGWPSFFTALPNAFETRVDYRLLYPRIEYHCARCGGHHGHVFDDGPGPNGQRWCNNGAALVFEASP